MSSPQKSDDKNELSFFYPTLSEDNNDPEHTQQDTSSFRLLVMSHLLNHITNLKTTVENEPWKGSSAPVTDQPASVIVKDNGKAENEGDVLLQNQKFSSKLSQSTPFKTWLCPCISIRITEKELTNENRAKKCCALSACLYCSAVTGTILNGTILMLIYYWDAIEIGQCSSAGFLAGTILAYTGLCGLAAVVCTQRRHVKKAYGIPYEFSDFLLSFCLLFSAIVQHERQVKSGRTKIV